MKTGLQAGACPVEGSTPSGSTEPQIFHGLAGDFDQRSYVLLQDYRQLEAKLNAPELHDFREAIVLEAAHQRERWGTEHDAGKTVEDWMWLVAYLSTKATQAHRYGDHEKYLHHIITCAAACANWHAHASGANTTMRPGQDPEKYEAPR